MQQRHQAAAQQRLHGHGVSAQCCGTCPPQTASSTYFAPGIRLRVHVWTCQLVAKTAVVLGHNPIPVTYKCFLWEANVHWLSGALPAGAPTSPRWLARTRAAPLPRRARARALASIVVPGAVGKHSPSKTVQVRLLWIINAHNKLIHSSESHRPQAARAARGCVLMLWAVIQRHKELAPSMWLRSRYI